MTIKDIFNRLFSVSIKQPVRISTAESNRLYGKSWFLADLSMCAKYLEARRLTPVCDKAIESLIIRSILQYKDEMPEISAHINVLEKVPIRGQGELEIMMRTDPSCVWISAGTSLGLPLRTASGVLEPGRIVGVAGCSAFNAGYAGITLHEWGENKLGRVIVRFYGGREVST